MRRLLDLIHRLLAGGDVDAAVQLCSARLAADPAAHALGMATIAMYRGDAAALREHATRALELGAGAVAYQYLAIGYTLEGDSEAAIELASQAVAHDDSPSTRAALGTILLAASRPEDALSVLRQVVFEQPSDHESRLHLAAASAEVGDHVEAITHYARAFVTTPGDYRPIQRLVAMFADLGKWLGAAAAVQLARTESAPPAEALVLDLVFVHVARAITGTYPEPRADREADRAVESLVATSRALGAAVQLVVAQTLVALSRLDAARHLLDAIEPTTDDERAARHIVRGALAEAEGDVPRAIECYVDAQATSAERLDASAKAISLLLTVPSPAARRRIAELLDRIPVPQRLGHPELMAHEAAYRTGAGELAPPGEQRTPS